MGPRLGTVRIVDRQDTLDLGDMLELRKHLMHVEYGPEVDAVDDCNYFSDEDDED